MTKPTKSKPASIQTLRDYLVPVTKDFDTTVISHLDVYNSERLVFLVDWESRIIFLTVLQGCYGPPRVHEGLDEEFDVRELFKPDFTVRENIGYEKGKTAGYYTLFLEYVLWGGRRALDIFKNASESDDDEEIKDKVRAVLAPYRGFRHQLHGWVECV